MINAARRLLKGAMAAYGARVYALSSLTTTSNSNGCVPLDAGGYAFAGGWYNGTRWATVVGVFSAFTNVTPTWARSLDMGASASTAFESYGGRGVGTDSSGNVYVLANGYTSGSVRQMHLIKYNSSGTLQWQRRLYSATLTAAGTRTNLAVTSTGDCYIAFSIGDTVQYNIVAKYNSSGTLQWQRKMSQATYEVTCNGCALTHDGGVITFGSMQDGGSSSSLRRGIVVKYNSSGAIQWQFKIHLAEAGMFYAGTVDQTTGDIYLAGYSGSTQFPTVWKLDSSGVVQWVVQTSTFSGMWFTSVVHDDASGLTYVSGVRSADDNLYVFCLDASGVHVWGRDIGKSTFGNPSAGSLAFDTNTANADKLIVTAGLYDNSSLLTNTMLLLPKGGGGSVATMYSGAESLYLEVEPAWTWASPASTKANAGLTDAAGALTEAAGIANDAASALTYDDATT
jgi:hypothetical protein